jgi:hypothetical protein
LDRASAAVAIRDLSSWVSRVLSWVVLWFRKEWSALGLPLGFFVSSFAVFVLFVVKKLGFPPARE